MSINLGSNPFGLYLGSSKIAEAYVGNVKIYSSAQPVVLPNRTMRFQFSNESYVPQTGTSTSVSSGVTSIKGTWTQVSTSPNIWDWYYDSPQWTGSNSKGLFRLNYSVQNTYASILGANLYQVYDIGYMFAPSSYTTEGTKFCDGLISISNVTNTGNDLLFMTRAFNGCSSLTSISLFDTSKASNMSYLFYNCTSLASIPLFNTSSVTDMTNMFYGCTSLASIPLFNTSSVTNMSNMFYSCSSLSSIPLFNTSSVTNMTSMLKGCTGLSSIPLFNTSSVTKMGQMCQGCTNVESGALALYQQASSQTTPPTSHSGTFSNCGSSTTTGAAELAQIPSDWGGTGA